MLKLTKYISTGLCASALFVAPLATAPQAEALSVPAVKVSLVQNRAVPRGGAFNRTVKCSTQGMTITAKVSGRYSFSYKTWQLIGPYRMDIKGKGTITKIVAGGRKVKPLGSVVLSTGSWSPRSYQEAKTVPVTTTLYAAPPVYSPVTCRTAFKI